MTRKSLVAGMLVLALAQTTSIKGEDILECPGAGVSKAIWNAIKIEEKSSISKHDTICVGVNADASAIVAEAFSEKEDQTADQATDHRKKKKEKKKDDEKKEDPNPVRVEEVAESGIIYVGSTGVNIRKLPHPDGAYITSVDSGTQLEIIGHYRKILNDQVLSDWTKVRYGGIEGYACTEYLTTECPLIDLGQFQITYYCPCALCCDVANRQTASGTWPEPGRTIATDPSIPFGTKLIIDGHEYIVEDRGGAITGNHIDMFVATHSEALQKGVHYTEVYMKKY